MITSSRFFRQKETERERERDSISAYHHLPLLHNMLWCLLQCQSEIGTKYINDNTQHRRYHHILYVTYYSFSILESNTLLALASMLLYINSSTTLGRSDRTTLERKELWALSGKRFMVCIYSYWEKNMMKQENAPWSNICKENKQER